MDQSTTDYLAQYNEKKKAFLEKEKAGMIAIWRILLSDPLEFPELKEPYHTFLDADAGDVKAKEQIEQIIEDVTTGTIR